MANDFKSATATSLAIDSGTYTTLYTVPSAKTSIILEVDIANKHTTDITVNVLISDSFFVYRATYIRLKNDLKIISGI